MKLTVEQIIALGELDRKMDSGEQPFVIVDGQRLAIPPEIMTVLQLVSGQTASDALYCRILEVMMTRLQEKIAEEEFGDLQYIELP